MTEVAKYPGWYRWGVLGIIMLGTFMAILDVSIVNVALPHMMSSFGVDRNKIEWVATGFMLTSAAVMPIMGWIAGRTSYKTLYLSCLGIFTVASGLCAMAWNLESLLVARILQAIGGGAIQPIGMAIVAELFEPRERGRALGIWGTGIMVGPALGPTLGGYLTDEYGWRTIFSVNLPVGVMTLLLGMLVMRPLYARGGKKEFDFWGYAFLAMTLIAGLTALSEGAEKGWDSDYIRICEAFTVTGGIMFFAVESAIAQPLFDLRLLLCRNYVLAILISVFRSIGLFGSVFLLPIFLQQQMGYTPIQAGLWMIPNAIAVGITMPIAGRLAERHPISLLASIGCIMAAFSLMFFGNLDPLSQWPMLVIPQLFRGTGLALMMAPLLAAALNAVPRAELAMASSFLNIAQNVGGSLGIALLNNFVTNAVHRHAVRLGEGFPWQSQAYVRFAYDIQGLVFHKTPGKLMTASIKAAYGASQALLRKAQVMGFQNGFMFAGCVMLLGLPLAFLLESMSHRTGTDGPEKAASPQPVASGPADAAPTPAEAMVEERNFRGSSGRCSPCGSSPSPR